MDTERIRPFPEYRENLSSFTALAVLGMFLALSGCATLQDASTCANNLVGCAVSADDRTIAQYQTPGGQVTISENDIERKTYFSFIGADGQRHEEDLNTITHSRVLGEWPTPTGAYIALEGTDPACGAQDTVLEVPFQLSPGKIMPVCGHFNFVPAENGLEAIGGVPGEQVVFLFSNGKLQGPESLSSFEAQGGAAHPTRMTRSTARAHAAPAQGYEAQVPAVSPPVDDFAELPQAAHADASSSPSAASIPSLDLVNH